MSRNLPPMVLLLAGLLCLSAWCHGRSITAVGDINIDITGDKFTCDKIVCPANTERCVVTKKKDASKATVLVRSNICYSPTNQVLKQSITNQTIAPNTRINVHIVAFRNGMTSMVNSYDSYTSTNIGGGQYNVGMPDWNKELDREMKSMHDELGSMYD